MLSGKGWVKTTRLPVRVCVRVCVVTGTLKGRNTTHVRCAALSANGSRGHKG